MISFYLSDFVWASLYNVIGQTCSNFDTIMLYNNNNNGLLNGQGLDLVVIRGSVALTLGFTVNRHLLILRAMFIEIVVDGLAGTAAKTLGIQQITSVL